MQEVVYNYNSNGSGRGDRGWLTHFFVKIIQAKLVQVVPEILSKMLNEVTEVG